MINVAVFFFFFKIPSCVMRILVVLYTKCMIVYNNANMQDVKEEEKCVFAGTSRWEL